MLRVTTLFIALLICLTSVAHAQIDLHAHLDLKPGVGPLLRGDFQVPALSLEWDSQYATKASAPGLTAFDSPPLIVVSLYGHPYFSVTEREGSLWQHLVHFDARENVRQAVQTEYEHVLRFLDQHPEFGLAKSPLEAENLLTDKRIPIVLSIEGAYGTLESEDDVKTWIDERGVAIVTPFHLTEDHFGGVAMMSGFYAFFQSPLSYLNALLLTAGDCAFNFCRSPVGIKPDGRELIDRLIRHHAWIDLAHANDLEIAELLPILQQKNLPLLVTHTSPREVYPAERGLPRELLAAIKSQDGIVGLLPTQDMLRKTWAEARGGARPSCVSSLTEYKATVTEMIRELGQERVAMASDINAPLEGLAPVCDVKPGQGLSELEERGFYTYSQWNQLGNYVAPDPGWHDRVLRHFITLWNRVQKP